MPTRFSRAPNCSFRRVTPVFNSVLCLLCFCFTSLSDWIKKVRATRNCIVKGPIRFRDSRGQNKTCSLVVPWRWRSDRNLVDNLRDQTAIAKEQPRNKSAEVKCVALTNSCRSRRIVTISFCPENGVQFDASCLSPGAEKYSNSEV